MSIRWSENARVSENIILQGKVWFQRKTWFQRRIRDGVALRTVGAVVVIVLADCVVTAVVVTLLTYVETMVVGRSLIEVVV